MFLCLSIFIEHDYFRLVANGNLSKKRKRIKKIGHGFFFTAGSKKQGYAEAGDR